MKSRLFTVLSLVLLASMLFSACAPAAQTPAPAQPTQAEVATAAPVQPTATTEAAKPTEAPTATAEAAKPTEAPTATEAPKTVAGWVDKIVFSAIADPEPAVAQLQAGTIDAYAVSNDDAQVYEKIKADKNLKYANVYGSSDQMLMNTDECTDKNILNPFSNMKIREAMNWAIDRNYIVQEIMGGLAQPKFSPITGAFPDAARNAGVLAATATKYAYNLEKAQAVVNEEMPKMGAKLDNGKWAFNGKPVIVIDLIRTEDKRKEIGQYFANQLEKLNFQVDRQEKTRKEAAPIWQGDPKECKFNVYTAGWISTSIARDEGGNFVQYNTGKVQGLPVMNDYKPSAELEKVQEPLFTNSYTTMDERATLFAKALDLSMQESWWGVWVVDVVAYEPYSAKFTAAYDLAGGFAVSQLMPYTMQKDGKPGGEVHIAQSGILVQPWNPIQGSNWVDDGMIQHQAADWGVVANPYTGLSMPKLVTKGEVTIKKGLPVTKTLDWVTLNFADSITVPDDAWADWDAKAGKWITAAEKAKADPNFKLTANSKSVAIYTPDLWKTKWHDGSNMSMADFMLNMILTFDIGKKDSPIFNEDYAPTVETYLTHFKGLKIVSTDPLTIETYDDTFSLDAENNVTSWYPASVNYGQGNFENLSAAIAAETDGKMAFTTGKATAKKIEWTSFIAGPTLDVQMSYVDKFAGDGTIPYAAVMGNYIKADEAKARFANLQAFYKAHKHIYLGTGAYMIDQVFPVEGTVTLVPFKDYTGKPGEFTGFGEPMIMTAAVDGPTQVKAGDEATFNVALTFGDQPYPSAQVDAVSYTVFNAKGDAIATGQAKMAAEGQYTITLSKEDSAKLEAGASKLSVAAASKAVSLPTFVTYEFVATK